MIGQIMAMVTNPAALLLQATQTNAPQLTQDQQLQMARLALQHGNGPLGAFIPIAFFAMIVLLVWLGTRRMQAQIQAQGELRKQLLDKFATAQELTTFLESRVGQQFLGEMRWRGAGPLRFLPGGVITAMLGLGFLGLAVMRRNFIVPAVILLAIGAGLLLSAAITHKLASKKNGQFGGPGSGIQSIPSA
jgi:hypothetical protein